MALPQSRRGYGPFQSLPGTATGSAAAPAARSAGGASPDSRPACIERFRRIRRTTAHLTSSLTVEDQLVQSGPEVSPGKWHLAHSTWFLERHLLERWLPGYRPFDDRYAYLFDCQQEPSGTSLPASRRGLLSRPALDEILRYREHVSAATIRLINETPATHWPDVARRLDLALHHELQHQEALLADIKHVFWSNPLRPAYRTPQPLPMQTAGGQSWLSHPGGLMEVGYDGDGFALDIERPRHRISVAPFQFAARLVTAGEYLEFIEDGGYRNADLWHPEGWALARAEGWNAPLYWVKQKGDWYQFTLAGTRLVDVEEPVTHVSWYEAAAYARWDDKRLPTEMEWELMAAGLPVTGNLLEYDRLHPGPSGCPGRGPFQMYGDGWEWTQSPLLPYPRQRIAADAVGEYAAQPPVGRMVLRGGSALTPGELIRPTYRHHLERGARWQMTGVRLASDA